MKASSQLPSTALVLTLATMLAACTSPGPTESDGTEPPATAPKVALTIKVKSADGAPDDFGLIPGDMITGAEIVIDSSDESGGPSYSATTDESGQAVVMVQSGSYRIEMEKGTYDPYCGWFGGEDVEVADKPVTVELYDIWLFCE